MYQSENLGELAKALAAAQGEMNAASKDATNPHFKTRYADLASIMDACRGPLAKHGLSVTQLPGRDEAGQVTLTTTLMHASGQYIGSTIGVRPAQENPQVVGSILTYLRRYTLASVVGVVSDDDDGEVASQPVRTASMAPRPQTARAEYTREEPVVPPPDVKARLDATAKRVADRLAPGATIESYHRSTDCPECGGQMWDNRERKTNPKAPDFKCKDKNCSGVIWKFKAPPAQAPIPGGHLEAEMRGAPPPGDDDIPF
jgi:hypothetical protein